jgi:predicted metal-dependent HD superfamily phosphohydrolase
MGSSSFTRLTNAFSKKIDNHVHALALFLCHYNFVRQHKSRNKSSPAMRLAWWMPCGQWR